MTSDERWENQDLPAVERLILLIADLQGRIQNGRKYSDLTESLMILIAKGRRFEIEEIKKGVGVGSWICPKCQKKMSVYSEDDIKKIQKGMDPNDESFRRAIPEDIRPKE